MKRQLFFLAVATILTGGVPTARALDPPTMEWQRTYGGSQMDVCYSVAPYWSNGGYLLAGASVSETDGYRDGYVIWTDADGDMMNEARYHYYNYNSEFKGVTVDLINGRWVAAGYSTNSSSVKEIWLHGEGSFGSGRSSPWNNRHYSSTQHISNAIFPAKFPSPSPYALDSYVVVGSLTDNGRWQGNCFNTDICGYRMRYGGVGVPGYTWGYSDADDEFTWGEQCSGQGYILTGTSGRNGGDIILARLDYWFRRKWLTIVFGDGGRDVAEFVGETADGGFIVAGTTSSCGSGGNDFLLLRADSLGQRLWYTTWGTSGDDQCLAAMIDATGEYVLAGYSGSPRNAALVKFNDNGELLWSTTFPGIGDEVCYTLLQTSDFGYLLGGMTDSSGNGDYDVWLMKTGREGPRCNVTLEVAGPTDWDYRLHWISGFVDRLVFRNLCIGTHGSCTDEAFANGWRATDYTDSVVFTTSTPLAVGSLHGFHLIQPECSGLVTWFGAENNGFLAGPSPPPSPPCVDHEAGFDRCVEQTKILYGSTLNGGNGCSLRPSNDQGWMLEIARAGYYTFDMCANAPGGADRWDSYLYLATECCDSASVIAENDDCPGVSGGQSRINNIHLNSGTYYLLVEGHDADDQWEYAITITSCFTLPHSEQADLGDLTTCNYPTLAGNPSHELTGVAWLGAGITAEASPNALNMDPSDDGVVFLYPPWTYCEYQSVVVTVTAGPNWAQYQQEGGCLFLNAWKDGNMDGDFCDTIDCGYWSAPEWIIQDMPVVAGLEYYVALLDPGDWRFVVFNGVFRFRLSSRTLGPYGFGLLDTIACPQMRCGTVDRDPVGEVEDYILMDFQTSVELLSFEAVPGDGEVRLRWITASETDNDYFEIQRDGARVAQVASQGNTASGHSYSWTDPGLENGVTYTYTLVSVDMNGTREDLGVRSATPQGNAASITEYALHQNYPNPFNPITNIAFDVVDNNSVTLMVYNATGQIVTTLLRDTPYTTGHHVVNFDAANLPSGLYFYTVKIGAEFTSTKKMLLIK